MARTVQQPKMTAGIGDIIESLKALRDAAGVLRSLPQSVELATLRGATGQEIVDLVKREISAFTTALTPGD
jgi:hypothetical protein